MNSSKLALRLQWPVVFLTSLLLLSCEQIVGFKPEGRSAATPLDNAVNPPVSGCSSTVKPPSADNILFYAPDIYAKLNGSANDNTYLAGAKNALNKAGFSVTVETTVDMKFDACQLYANYSQVWLFLPCNNLQTLSNESINNVKRYFDAGQPLAVFSDAHYFDGTQLNSHCMTYDPYFGNVDKPSDVYKVLTQIAGVKPVNANGKSNPISANHPMAKIWDPLKVAGTWNFTFQIDGSDVPNFRDLGGNGIAPVISTSHINLRALLEIPEKTGTRTKKLFFDLTDYNYHVLGMVGSETSALAAPMETALQQTAKYFAGQPNPSLQLASANSASDSNSPTRAPVSGPKLLEIKSLASDHSNKANTVRISQLMFDISGTESADQMLPSLVNFLQAPITSTRHQAAWMIEQHWIKEQSLVKTIGNLSDFGPGQVLAIRLLALNGSEAALEKIRQFFKTTTASEAILPELIDLASDNDLRALGLLEFVHRSCSSSTSESLRKSCLASN